MKRPKINEKEADGPFFQKIWHDEAKKQKLSDSTIKI